MTFSGSGIYKKVLVGAASCFMALGAQAVTLETLVGTTITYVYDKDQAAVALFGEPILVGDTVVFTPLNFRAESTNGAPGSDVVSANFVFENVYANDANAWIDSINVSEEGDYRIDTDGYVSVDLRLQGSTNSGSTFGRGVDTASFSSSGDSGGIQEWGTLSASLSGSDIVDPFSGESVGPQNSLTIGIQNNLTAITDANGETAWVEKKLNFTAVSAVPLPAAAWLFGSAMIGLLAVGRRRKA